MNEKRIKKIYRDIRDVKIQGATNVAKAAIDTFYLNPSEKNKKELMKLRPTEPMLINALNLVTHIPRDSIIAHFGFAQNRINRFVFKVIDSKKKIYTHCHSTNVLKALVFAKKHGKRFEVLNTETRPLYQGRLTATELAKNGIKVTDFVDSAMDEAVGQSDLVLLGSDAILKSGIINKIGSGAIAKLAFLNKKPVYIVADSWKYSPKNVKIEERSFKEVWKNVPKHIRIRNPAFEKVEKKYIKGIISEYGILSFDKFLKVVDKRN
jgi:ribose 1,5-bisphosphate isomerase